MRDSLPRLRAILAHLPLDGGVRRILNVGCGDFPSMRAMRTALPDWTIVGMDRDGRALHRARHALHANPDPALHLVQADARDLPALFRAAFGLIVIRHPDLFRNRTMWEHALPQLPAMLAPGGVLLITLYATEEVEFIGALDLPAPLSGFDNGVLPRVDLAGRDRFVRVYAR